MGFRANWDSRKAYQAHLQGNQLIDKGDSAGAKEKHELALSLYEKSYAGGVRNANILMAFGVLLMRFGRCEEARDRFLECERQKDLDAKSKKQLRINYSVCQWKLGNLDKAIELMKTAAAAGKTSMIYTTLGYYLIEKAIQTGDFEEALEFNKEGLEYDEEDAGALDNMGQLYYAMGDKEKAFDFFTKAHEAKPTQVPTTYFLARIYNERGNKEKAREFVEKCLEGNFSALCSISKEQVQALSNEIG